MRRRKQVRIIKKVRGESGAWRFISLEKVGERYVWDKRPGTYFLDWWEGPSRKRQSVGTTPSEALEAKRRKAHELIGRQVSAGEDAPVQQPNESEFVTIPEAREMFLDHIRVHSPDKPRTLQRYEIVLQHFEKVLANRRYIQAITRADIDEFKSRRSLQRSHQAGHRRVAPRTINYEVSVLRTFFYFLINERNVKVENPCARFKPLRDPREKANRKPPVYSPEEIDKLMSGAEPLDEAIFRTLLLTGMRELELCNLTWEDICFTTGDEAIRVNGEGKDDFSPKDYEERVIPIPGSLAEVLRKIPRRHRWVFPRRDGNRMTHLLRRLKRVAARVGVENATLHKFRHTYATRLLEKGADIVTVQELMGHSDIETTRQYLNPSDDLKRKAVLRLVQEEPASTA